jgi:hypothetical protein
MSYLDNRNNLAHKIFGSVTFFLAAFPIFPNQIIGVLIAIWVICGVWYSGVTKPRFQKEEIVFIVLMTLPYLLFIVGMLWSEHPQKGAFILEKKAGMLFIPVTLFLAKDFFTKTNTKTILIIFSYACLVFGLGTNLYFGYKLFDYAAASEGGTGVIEFILKPDFVRIYRERIAYFSSTHTPYLGIYYCIAGIFFTFFLLQEKASGLKRKLFYLISIAVFLFFIMLMGTRSAFIGYFATTGFLAFMHIRLKQKRMALIVGSILVFGVSILAIPTLRHRMMEIFQTENSLASLENHNAVNVRVGIFYCAFQVLQDNWVFGTGTGDLQPILNKEYEELGAQILIDKKYNVHNEYLNAWLTVGILGIISLFAFFITTFIMAWKKNNILYCSLLILFCISFLTENVLSRQDGVIAFTFFCTLLFFGKTQNSDTQSA